MICRSEKCRGQDLLHQTRLLKTANERGIELINLANVTVRIVDFESVGKVQKIYVKLAKNTFKYLSRKSLALLELYLKPTVLTTARPLISI
ncbi:MAG: hypothetical protein H7Z37_15100 [Pyrinomonadaceae bacterium]|nr:hypothetical protein [Pyrinomonadaceae bacterium]